MEVGISLAVDAEERKGGFLSWKGIKSEMKSEVIVNEIILIQFQNLLTRHRIYKSAFLAKE